MEKDLDLIAVRGKSSTGPRALIWVPIEPTSCFGFFRSPPLGYAGGHHGLNIFVHFCEVEVKVNLPFKIFFKRIARLD